MKKTFRFAMLSGLLLLLTVVFAAKSISIPPADQQYYEIKIYHVYGPQEARVDAYLKDVYLPALHRAGIASVGVFKPLETDLQAGKNIYVFIPYKTLEQYASVPDLLAKDLTYQNAGKPFLAAPHNDAPYSRHESILLKAFKNYPIPFFPEYKNDASERVYELRSYESATEDLALRKIHMFNEGGEIDIFTRLGFNAVFYGEVLVGSAKPNLMYMTTFTDMKSRD